VSGGNPEKADPWENLEDLPDAELAALAQAAVSVLQWNAEGDIEDVEDMPPGALERELEDELAGHGVEDSGEAARKVVRDEEMARPVAVALLWQIAEQPELRARVDEVYRKRKDMLVVGTGVILAGAFLLLAMKLKKVKIGKEGAEVEFEPIKEGALARVLAFLGS
jgi:hypothetical protein